MILTNDKKTYAPAPEGAHNGVCVDVIDLGVQDTEWGPKPKLRLTFELETLEESGEPYRVSRSFTASLHPKAKLSEIIGKWRGKAIGDNESFDLNKLVGQSALLVISNKTDAGTGRTFALIDNVMKKQKVVVPSGRYDGAAARKRIDDFAAKQANTSREDGNDKVLESFPAPRPVAAPKAVQAPHVNDCDVPF